MESHVPKRQERMILRDGRRHGETLEKGDRLSMYNSLRGHACFPGCSPCKLLRWEGIYSDWLFIIEYLLLPRWEDSGQKGLVGCLWKCLEGAIHQAKSYRQGFRGGGWGGRKESSHLLSVVENRWRNCLLEQGKVLLRNTRDGVCFSMHQCMYIYVPICAYVCKYMYSYTCIYVYCVSMCEQASVCTSTYICVCMCVWTM